MRTKFIESIYVNKLLRAESWNLLLRNLILSNAIELL